MPYLPLPKLLDKYFYAEEIEKMLQEIHEIPTSNKNDNIKLLIKEWPRRGKNYHAFIEMLPTPEIREICRTYGIDSKGKEKELIKRIKKAKLLEPDTPMIENVSSRNRKNVTFASHSLWSKKEFKATLIATLVIAFGVGTFFFFLENPDFLNELLSVDCLFTLCR